MGQGPSKNQVFMEQRERSNTYHRKQGTLARNLVREEFNRDIQEVYDLRSGELLGKGGFGTVRVVTHKATQNKYALKTIELKDVETVEQYEFLLNEIEIMKQLDHPNIARVQEVFHTPDHYYMVMDLYTGGDMYARYKFRSEDETAKIVNKLINALRYCHDRNVAHRDIKLENICFESMADNAEVKLVDFGLSASFEDEQLRHDLVGSFAFMAPEVLQRAHNPQACDMWSMGVVTYCLLAGFPPFRSVNLKGLKEQILFRKVTFEEEPWRNVSNTAKDFIQKLLKKDPHKRWTAQQAQHHPWLTRARSSKKNAKLSPKVVDNLRHFKSLNLMKRVALGVVARTLEPSEMRNLEQEFHKADITRSGEISIEDFRAVLCRSKQFQPRELDEIFEGLDIGSSGLLSYTDFTAAALNRQTLDNRRLKYAFERLDHDNNGYLDYEDLMMTVGSDLSTEDVRTAIKQFDTDNNGQVSFDDFCKGMRSTGGALDALSTAQMTSGYMVESIAKGEGAAAIQTVIREDFMPADMIVEEPLPSGIPESAEKLVPPLRQQQQQWQQQEQQQQQKRQEQQAGDGRAGGEVEAVGASAEGSGRPKSLSSTATTAAVSLPQSIDRTAPRAVASSKLNDAGGSSGGGEGLGSRPQSLGRPGALAMKINAAAAAAAGSGTGTDVDVTPSSSLRRQSSVDRKPEAGVLANGDATAVGAGGAEATAPTSRISPGGGARVDPPPPPPPLLSPGGSKPAPSAGAAGVSGAGAGTAGAAVGTAAAADAPGEVTKESLAGRRMRDSIRIRGGLGGLALPPGTTAASIGPGLAAAAAAAGVTWPGQSVASQNPSPSAKSIGLSSSSARVAATASLQAGDDAAAGGALGAAAGSAQSGGEPAASESKKDKDKDKDKRRSLLPSFLTKKLVKTVAADLPPRDSTVEAADLGWGSQGAPPDLASVEGSSGSSSGKASGAMRSPKMLRFDGVAASSTVGNGDGKRGKHAAAGKKKSERRQHGRGGRRGGARGASRELFCLPGTQEGGKGPGGPARDEDGGFENAYRNYDSVSSDDLGSDAQTRRRTGTFCMPGNSGEDTVPFWVTWINAVFGGKPA